MTSKVMTLKIPEELKEEVEKLAREDDRSQAYIIIKAIKAYIKKDGNNTTKKA